MRPLLTRPALLALGAAAAAWLSLAGPARAQEAGSATTLVLATPATGAVGREMTLVASLRDRTGAAAEGAEVVFRRVARFMNSSGELEIGRALTDAEGVARLSFVPRSEGELLILADFDGDGRYGPGSGEATVLIETGPGLYSVEAGVRVPGINVSLLIAILGAVWGAYFVVMARIWLIARDDAAAPPAPEGAGE